jgi:hypothetical protein
MSPEWPSTGDLGCVVRFLAAYRQAAPPLAKRMGGEMSARDDDVRHTAVIGGFDSGESSAGLPSDGSAAVASETEPPAAPPDERGDEKWWQGPLKWVRRVWQLAVILMLLLIAKTAVWLGAQDAFRPVSTAAQLLGTCFIVAGILAFIGFLLVAARMLPHWPRWATGEVQTALISGAAASGLYVSITIVAHAFHYEPARAWRWGAIAAGCLLLALQTLPGAWRGIGNFMRVSGVGLAVLGSVSVFYYQSFYLPENTQIGLQLGVSIGTVVKPGADEVVPVDLTIANQSSVTALTLGSMVIISAVTMPESSAALPDPSAQRNMISYANDLIASSGPTVPDPNVRSSGSQTSRVLAVMQPIPNDSYVFSNDTYSRQFDVVIPDVPKNKITALEIEIRVMYARTTRLVLQSPSTATSGELCTQKNGQRSCCPNGVRSSWPVAQSALVRFTRGAQVLSSDWCASLNSPSIKVAIKGIDGAPETSAQESAILTDINYVSTSSNEIFVLP